MKHTLKNFPLKVTQQGIDITLMTTPKLSKDDKKIIKIAEWKVGFEKELREMLKDYSRSDIVWEWSRLYHFIQEILGDSE